MPFQKKVKATNIDPRALLYPGLTMEEAEALGLAEQQDVEPLGEAASRIVPYLLPGASLGRTALSNPPEMMNIRTPFRERIRGILSGKINPNANDPDYQALDRLIK